MSKDTIILFDLDGTLIDSTEAILESFRVSFEKFKQKTPSDNEIKSKIGLPLDIMFAQLGVVQGQIDQYVKAYKEHYRTIHTLKTTLLPDAMKTITLADTFAHLGIVTTKTSKYSRELLEYFDVMKYFDVLIGKDEVTHPKPDPEPIQKALEALPKVAGGKYMIGDTCMDMDAAHNAHIVGMGVLCGYGAQEQLQQCTKFIYKNASEAVNAILKK